MVIFFQYLTIYHCISLLALAIGIYQFLKGKVSLKYFNSFLIFVNFVEIFLNYYLSKKYGSTERMYSVYSFICALYYIFIFYLYFNEKPWATFLKFGIIIWAISCTFLLLYTDKSFEIRPYYSGMAITIGLIFAFFYHILYVEKYQDLTKQCIFYLSLGILLFVFTTFPILSFYDELVLNLDFADFFNKLLQYGNVFISLGYLGVVICAKK